MRISSRKIPLGMCRLLKFASFVVIIWEGLVDRVESFVVGHRQPPYLQGKYATPELRRGSSSLNLFFKLDQTRPEQRITKSQITPETVEALSLGLADLPYRTLLPIPKWMRTNEPEGSLALLTLRLMEYSDIPEISELCAQEYGSGVDRFPGLLKPGKWLAWLDQHSLRQLVEITSLLKLILNNSNSQQVSDHAVLVASLTTQRQQKIVGMIEVSRQPVLPDRNPPPMPIPLPLKKMYCKVAKKPLEAWVANLLVAPEARGMGLGKLLVGGAEGLARRLWKCKSIHLHCDADAASGKIPQKLYLSLGYETVPAFEMNWLQQRGDAADYLNGIYFIEGVPLLYLQKKLAHQPSKA